MEKSSSSDDVSEAARRTSGVYYPCLIIEAVKSIMLKCFGAGGVDDFRSQANYCTSDQQKEDDGHSSVQEEESCSCSSETDQQTADPPPSTITADSAEADPPTEDAAATAVSLAAPPRPEGSMGRGPQIN